MTSSEKQPEKVHARRAMVTGFVALFPIVLTVLLLYWCWRMIQTASTPVHALMQEMAWLIGGAEALVPKALSTLVALILAVIFVYALGWSLAYIFGKRMMGWADKVFSALPVVNYVYPHAKQLSDFLFGERKVKFSRVVAIEYPRKGLYSIGFVTSEGLEKLSRHVGKKMISVFVPTSPTPFTGWTVLVDESEVMPMSMSVDEAVRYTVTCGVITSRRDAESLAHDEQRQLPDQSSGNSADPGRQDGSA